MRGGHGSRVVMEERPMCKVKKHILVENIAILASIKKCYLSSLVKRVSEDKKLIHIKKNKSTFVYRKV